MGLIENQEVYLLEHVAIQTILQRKQKKIDADPFKSQNHRFAVHEYKIWGINCLLGPFKVFKHSGFDDAVIISNMAMISE